MCIGTSAGDYDHYSPELKDKHLSGISFDETNYLMPWALHTIPPGGLITTQTGELTEDGEKLRETSPSLPVQSLTSSFI